MVPLSELVEQEEILEILEQPTKKSAKCEEIELVREHITASVSRAVLDDESNDGSDDSNDGENSSKTLDEEIEALEEEFGEESEEEDSSIEYGPPRVEYGFDEESIYAIASELYGSPESSGNVDYEHLFSYMGKRKTTDIKNVNGNEDAGMITYDSETQEFGSLEGKDAQSIVDRLYLQELFGDATLISPEEKLKFRYWKWFNPAERRLYERQSAFHQTPYWQLAAPLEM